MKSGQTLQEIATEVKRQTESKEDFIVPTQAMDVATDDAGTHLRFAVPQADRGERLIDFPLTDIAHRHLSNFVSIPAVYYDRMRIEQPALLDANIRTWLHNREDARMVRTLDQRARALASRSYRPLDNFEMLESIVPVLAEMGGPGMADLQFESTALTERKLYLKVVAPRIQTEIRKGDVVQMGMVISNSEVLDGAVSIQPLIYRLVCLNGMIAQDRAIRQAHIGRRNGDLDIASEFLRDETRELDDAVLWMKVTDTLRGLFSSGSFERIVDRLRDAADQPIKDPVGTVEAVAKQYSFTEDEKTSVLEHLITGADLSAYGLMNAVTRASQDVPSYDRATTLERVGGQIIELKRSEWSSMLHAA